MPNHKYARIERERRFLICELPDEILASEDFQRITDLYIRHTRLRLRRMQRADGETTAYKLGQKYTPDEERPGEMLMTNIYLSEEEHALLAQLEGEHLVKKRYRYRFAGQDFSIDVFEDELEGLSLCEVELPESENASVHIPSFAGREVTDDGFYSGGELARLSQAELARRLADEC